MSQVPNSLTTWDYRIFERQLPQGAKFYFVGEAYYDDNGNLDGGYSESYEGMVGGGTVEELSTTYIMMAEAFTRPVIKLDKHDKIIKEEV